MPSSTQSNSGGTARPALLYCATLAAFVLAACAAIAPISLLAGRLHQYGWAGDCRKMALGTNERSYEWCRDPAVASRYGSRPPTRLRASGDRYHRLEDVMAGYERTGVPLVALEASGKTLSRAELSDNPGLYLFAPIVIRALHLSMPSAYDALIEWLSISAGCIGLAGLLLLMRTNLARGVAIAGVFCLTCGSLLVGDLYCVGSSLVLATVPWEILALRRLRPSPQSLVFLAAGLAAGCAYLVRPEIGALLLVTAVALIATSADHSRARRAMLCLAVLATFAIAPAWEAQVASSRTRYLEQVGGDTTGIGRHTIWHNAYLGFGFVHNTHVPEYYDSVAEDYAHRVAPGVEIYSAEYDRLMRSAVFDLIRTAPLVVIENVLAKIGVIALMILVLGNAGLLLAWRFRHSLQFAAFAAAIAFAALPGILTIPHPQYLTGLYALVLLLAIFGLNEWSYAREQKTKAAVA